MTTAIEINIAVLLEIGKGFGETIEFDADGAENAFGFRIIVIVAAEVRNQDVVAEARGNFVICDAGDVARKSKSPEASETEPEVDEAPMTARTAIARPRVPTPSVIAPVASPKVKPRMP